MAVINTESVSRIAEVALVKTQNFSEKADFKLLKGITVDAVVYNSDLASRVMFQELLNYFTANPTATVPVKTLAGTWATIDQTLCRRICRKLTDNLVDILTWHKEIDTKIEAAVASQDLTALRAVGKDS